MQVRNTDLLYRIAYFPVEESARPMRVRQCGLRWRALLFFLVVNPLYITAQLIWFVMISCFLFLFGLHVERISKDFDIVAAESKFWPVVADLPIVPLTVLIPVALLYLGYYIEKTYPTFFHVAIGVAVVLIAALVIRALTQEVLPEPSS